MLEKDLQKKILQRLKAEGWFVKYSGLFRGVPDILGCIYGRFVAIEVKRPGGGGRPTRLQLDQICAIRARGGYAYIVESMDQLEAILESLKWSINNG